MQDYKDEDDVTPDKPTGGVFDFLSNLNGLTPAGLEHLIQTQQKYAKPSNGGESSKETSIVGDAPEGTSGVYDGKKEKKLNLDLSADVKMPMDMPQSSSKSPRILSNSGRQTIQGVTLGGNQLSEYSKSGAHSLNNSTLPKSAKIASRNSGMANHFNNFVDVSDEGLSQCSPLIASATGPSKSAGAQQFEKRVSATNPLSTSNTLTSLHSTQTTTQPPATAVVQNQRKKLWQQGQPTKGTAS